MGSEMCIRDRDLGVNLHLKHPDPVGAVNSGEIIPSHRVKEVLKKCVKEEP